MTAAAVSLVERWAHLYADSKLVSAGVTWVHLTGIVVAGGFAVTTDRASLRLRPAAAPAPELARLHEAHRWVLGGLAVTAVSGVFQLFADLHTYLGSDVFWVKMGLIALLLVNGWVRLTAERRLEGGAAAAWRRFHLTSAASLALWFMVLLAGELLTTVS